MLHIAISVLVKYFANFIFSSLSLPQKKHPQTYLLRPNDMLMNAVHILLLGSSYSFIKLLAI